MKVKELAREMQKRLAPDYGIREAYAMTSLIFHALKGWDRTQLLINSDLPVSERMLSRAGEILVRLENHEPLQYILGEAYFYGMDLKVTPAVLIPRPETAELVDLIVDRYRDRQDLRVLDAGTGSGAIAIALARSLPFSQVTAIDISEAALEVARENATALKARITFLHEDIFIWAPAPRSFDIIVSNPPYVTESERKDMDANVLDHEPATALFVPDSDPLRYYRRIADMAVTALQPGGSLWFEINPLYADAIATLLSERGFTDVTIERDAQGKQRFATAILPTDD